MDPYIILNVSENASDQEVKAAYLKMIKAYPPEQNQRFFEVIREAFTTLETERDRLKYQLFDITYPSVSTLIYACLENQACKKIPVDVFNTAILEGVSSAIQRNIKNL